METFPRPSTFASSTGARRCAWPKAETPIQLPGERDTLTYIPLGVGAVIPPWNFACAIMAGMTVASVVTGNTVDPQALERFADRCSEVR